MSEIGENIVIIGFMGAGKSSLSREMARILEFQQIDTDDFIEAQEKQSVSEIFKKNGEAYFRELEHLSLKHLIQTKTSKAIISTGGGMPITLKNRPLIRKLGCVVWLRTTSHDTYQRLQNNTTRPLLEGNQMKEKIETLMKQRAPVYRDLAQFKVDTDGLNTFEIADGVIDSVNYFFSQLKGFEKTN